MGGRRRRRGRGGRRGRARRQRQDERTQDGRHPPDAPQAQRFRAAGRRAVSSVRSRARDAGPIRPGCRALHTGEANILQNALHSADALFAAWNESGVRWALLRDPGSDTVPVELDLLVDARQLTLAERALGRFGYRRQVAPGRGPRRFYWTYRDDLDRWIKLDIVTEIALGRHQEIVTKASDGVLDRAGGSLVRHPAAADAYALLLLHYLLDGSAGRLRHRMDLPRMRAVAEGGFDPRPSWGVTERTRVRLDRAVAAASWGQLDALARTVRDELGGRTVTAIARGVANRAVRAAARRVPMRGGGGATLALLGPDGAGKSTLADALTASVPMPVAVHYLGTYGAGLRLPRGLRAGLIARLVAMMRGWVAGARHATRGGLTLYDRHPVEALGRPRAPRWRARARRWLLGHSVPSPDGYLILDGPAHVLHARKPEHDVPAIEGQRRQYLSLAETLRSATIIDVDRPADEVRREATHEVWRAVRRRLLRPR